MLQIQFASICAFSATLLAGLPAAGQSRPDPDRLIEAQRNGMAALAFMDGVWRGTATTLLPSGEKQTLVQTERVGAFLGGAVKVVEGRGYDADGKVAFNAFAVISFDVEKGTYNLRSYALGKVGDFPLTLVKDGFMWEIPAGPATIRYAATIRDGTWHEIGDYVMPGKEPTRFFEMTLTRLGDTDWPSAGSIGPK